MEISDKMPLNQCCGTKFRFEYEDLRSLRPNISIRPIGIRGILIMYVKDGKLYYSVSFDCGKTFSEPQVIFDINGTVLTMQIDDKDKEVVVGLLILDDKTRQTVKKAATGEITDDGRLDLRQCAQPVLTDNPLSVTVGFRPWLNPKTNQLDGYESVDYVSQIVTSNDKDEGKGSWIKLDCHGHM
jgi:hypothetical protein